MSQFSKCTPINNVIAPHTMNQSSTTFDSQINDAINILSDDLYPFIGEMGRNFLTHYFEPFTAR